MTLWNFIKEHMLENPIQRIYEDQASLSYEETVIFILHVAYSPGEGVL